MNFEISGNIIVKEDTQDISASFKKREFVIEVVNERNSDWNDFIKFQLTQDRCNLLDPLQVGDNIKVSFNIRGRKWEKDGRVNYFSNLEAWRIEKEEAALPPDAPAPSFNEADIPPAGPEEDLPF
ncbi:DUF3127 domain-containing protein [Carboxylicivirga sediminis]|uniref:DUF3127 domain-containing protein n=1 Tax=Carboxylicivirga sediminis TaxID=2006564 RepID=A0A941F810_9BACT|nr:DUF3127 domain-containing protein [Carboxylicivirga sediminis]MBR8538067.1 DUF3127 domain-containing protein [Carboxylicivirga sediminis]